ncbi:Disease resistance protein [Quillaja saponaria]|uniref:Disease resistance protein n=1 Tax=Quillaja saponaria TaxID=32244 RepID=A0AAD7LMC4_QUISA|nr:Disease resistance protein [Quillaja saponaria]
MAEVGIAVGAKVAEYLVDPVMRRARYLFCVNKIVEDLKKEKEKLISTQVSIQERVNEATNRTHTIDSTVEKWLKEVDNVIEEVQKLEEEIKTIMICFLVWCPNVVLQYRLCKQMSKKIVTLTELNKNCKFNQLSRLATLPGIEYFCSEDFLYFESTKLAYDDLLEALTDARASMIGLYGMGGSGKTTLVKEVGKKAKELKIYDKVVFVAVSDNVNIRKMQGEIADSLGLKLEEESESGRARRIWLRLTSQGRTLVILDDVWAYLDLKVIGIPFKDNTTSCNVLLTTRRQEICISMGCQTTIQLSILNEEEEWILFQKHASIADDSSTLNGLAQEVARECKGLPIAIVVVGTSLKGKGVDEWMLALNRLRDSKPMEIEEGLRNPYACLKLSYDHLKSAEAKLVFLLCSLFPEDYEISVEDLFRIRKGIGVCKSTHESLDDGRSKVRVAINILIDSCLLLRADRKKHHVKMHDMVRDVALWIASGGDHVFLVNGNQDLDVFSDGEAKDYTAISLWNQVHNICQLDSSLAYFPKLDILSLDISNQSYFVVSESFFEGMKQLKVLDLGGSNGSWALPTLKLPQSIKLLTNLQTLGLSNWDLGDITVLGSLKGLERLEFYECSINELPAGIVEVKKLKLLNLRGCSIRRNPYEVIGRCSQLEELYISGIKDFEGWESEGREVARYIPENVSFPRLLRFVIQNGKFESFKLEGDLVPRAVLYLDGLDASISSNASVSYLMHRAEVLYLQNLRGWGGCKNLIPDLDQARLAGFNELIELSLVSCPETECLIDTTSTETDHHYSSLIQEAVDSVFSKLVKLTMIDMDCLEALYSGPTPHCFLEKLQELYIQDCGQLCSILFPRKLNLCSLRVMRIESCPMLISLFTLSITRTLVRLEELEIRNCKELKHITEVTDNEIEGQEIHQNDHLATFSRLKSLLVVNCDKLECVFPISLAQGLVQLERIHIRNTPELKYVFSPCNPEDQNVEDMFNIELPVLKTLKLNQLRNLISICWGNHYPTWPSLQDLDWKDCPGLTTTCIIRELDQNKDMRVLNLEGLYVGNCRMEDIFQFQGQLIDGGEPLTASLYRLQLCHLPELRVIWKGPKECLSLQNLYYLEVIGCRKLKTIFSPTVVRSLPQLETVVIRDCEELETIISDGKEHQVQLNTYPRQGCFPKLSWLIVRHCNSLKYLFPIAMARDFPQLKCLEVAEAYQIEEIFGYEAESRANCAEEIVLPKLETVILKSLPSITDICQGIRLQPEVCCMVKDCPKYASTLAATVLGN